MAVRFINAAAALAMAGCAGIAAKPPQSAADPAAVQVMVVGSFHMAGSDADLINTEVENVLTEKRQAELADLADALATFAPTVVVTERVTAPPDYIDPKFAEFGDAMLRENPNERVQVAYRLARRAGVSRVYGIDEQPQGDEPDYFPFDKLMAHAEATGKAAELEAYLGEFRESIGAFEASTAEDHIALKLLKINQGPSSAPDFYYGLAAFDEGEAQPAAELQAYWFMRNAKIWSKVMNVVEPGDRVVIVYGAGHKYWLEHMADHTAGFVRIDPSPYLEKAAR